MGSMFKKEKNINSVKGCCKMKVKSWLLNLLITELTNHFSLGRPIICVLYHLFQFYTAIIFSLVLFHSLFYFIFSPSILSSLSLGFYHLTSICFIMSFQYTHMVATNQKPTTDTKKLGRKEHKHTTKENHQTIRKETKRRAEKNYKNSKQVTKLQ